jgi:hypothetical protein
MQNSAMNIAVQQRVLAFSSEYEIETPACIYSAKKKSFFLCDKIRLFAPRSRLLATIRGHFSFRPKYDIHLADGKVYHFCCEKFWKVIVSMALVMDCGELEDDTGGAVTIDLGSLGPEERPFDPSWEPS